MNPSLPGGVFCVEHMKSCPRVSPLNGYEPKYNPAMWNRRIEVRETHNCFSYAFNVNDPRLISQCLNKEDCDTPFPQPGMAAGYDKFSKRKAKTCPNMLKRLMGDNPDIKRVEFEDKCPEGTSMIALVVDPKQDYHFLRKDGPKGFWSHKAGARPVTNVDANGHKIWDPQLCDLKYDKEELHYNIFCGYLCVPRTKPVYVQPGGARRNTARKRVS